MPEQRTEKRQLVTEVRQYRDTDDGREFLWEYEVVPKPIRGEVWAETKDDANDAVAEVLSGQATDAAMEGDWFVSPLYELIVEDVADDA